MTVGEFLWDHLWHAGLMAVLLVCSAFFSGSETAYFSLSRADMLRFGRSTARVDRLVDGLLRTSRKLLMVLLLGNQLVNVAFWAIAAVFLVDLQQITDVVWWGEALLVVAPLVTVILLGEVAPKNLALSSPARIAQVVALPLTLLVRVLGPVQWLLGTALVDPLTRLLRPARLPASALSPDELADLLDLAQHRQHLAPTESAWIQEVIELGRIRVADIMVPRVDMVTYDIDQGTEGLIEAFRRTRLIKMPVYRDSQDNLLGVIYAKQLLLAPDTPLAKLVRHVPFVPETGTVDKLLVQFRRTRTQMAFVVDEYGGTAGLVTLEDAMEEVVGEITAPDEEVTEPVQRFSRTEYRLAGDLPIREWTDVFNVELPAEGISTVGGLVMSLLDRVPREGDTVVLHNLQFTVESMQRHRIAWLGLKLLEQESTHG